MPSIYRDQRILTNPTEWVKEHKSLPAQLAARPLMCGYAIGKTLKAAFKAFALLGVLGLFRSMKERQLPEKVRTEFDTTAQCAPLIFRSIFFPSDVADRFTQPLLITAPPVASVDAAPELEAEAVTESLAAEDPHKAERESLSAELTTLTKFFENEQTYSVAEAVRNMATPAIKQANRAIQDRDHDEAKKQIGRLKAMKTEIEDMYVRIPLLASFDALEERIKKLPATAVVYNNFFESCRAWKAKLLKDEPGNLEGLKKCLEKFEKAVNNAESLKQ